MKIIDCNGKHPLIKVAAELCGRFFLSVFCQFFTSVKTKTFFRLKNKYEKNDKLPKRLILEKNNHFLSDVKATRS
jgi:hypothetical protein